MEQNKSIYPEFGEKIMMLSDLKVIRNSKIGNHVAIAAHAYIEDAGYTSVLYRSYFAK